MTKATLDIVVYAEVALNHISKIPDNLIGILVEQPLQLGHLLVVVEVLLILCVQLNKDSLIVLQCLNKLLSASLLCQI